MIRHPLRMAARPTVTADISRVTEGISTSLRQFSAAQQRLADDEPKRQSGRERAATAVKDLLSMGQASADRIREPQQQSGSAAPASASASAVSPLSQSNAFVKPTEQQLKIIDIKNVSFRGRGGGLRGGESRGGARGRGRGGPRGEGGRGGIARRARGGGSRGNRVDRRANPNAKQKDDEEDVRKRKPFSHDKGVIKHEREKAEGTMSEYDPTVSVASLTAYMPAMSLSGHQPSQGAAASQQVWTLGTNTRANISEVQPCLDEVSQRSADGKPILYRDEQMKEWVRQSHVDVPGPNRVPVHPASDETRQAVLETALLGKYDKPSAVIPGQGSSAEMAIAAINNYTRKGSTWDSPNTRNILEKVRSLLPAAAAAQPSPAAAQPQAKGGNKAAATAKK